ncbi:MULTISPECIES: hypothetical protein [unclassified Gilliamella]|uniref:hypothetical protein n=1 Tax=unclassified Gilliamella TaxID=2685620 RepID=UPI00226AC075|nr:MULTISPECIES: hypothetical protein [unclassified Gilliamella]MCX8641307.1 hypothetical protein [Gilliamella sp. B3835]MCX8707418.1 hypothetical protein [Gilliamella sp. B3783]MCX8710498.1 hypothetical protein [Gilliamella sp. B3780]MCX8714613.1 hypothetical protein [Gilliamella sp. B3781]MCX8716576.1 hypothetical protein [Gilliamella sp. B3784]
MKNLLFIKIVLFFISFCCYGEEINIIENYKGKSILDAIDISKLAKDCEKTDNFWHITNTEREEILERCPINQIASYFENLYDIIKNNVVIYDVDDVKLTINKKIYNKTVNNKIYPVKELNLFLFHKGKFVDKIILANSSYDVEGYYWLSNQYYYISPNMDVYVLLVKDVETSVKPIFWKHYQIDKKNLQFQLKALSIDEGYKYQITYPDQFKILEGSPQTSKYQINKLKTCYQEEYSTSCSIESYRYYHNILFQKLSFLETKNPQVNEFMEIIDKEINMVCLSSKPPNYQDETKNFTNKITKCLTEQLYQKIEGIDQKLAE